MITLAYDVEVFEKQSCVVFKNLDGETVRIFTDNLSGLGEYIDSGVLTHQGYKGLKEYLEDKVLIGYNNYHYDDYILYAMAIELDSEHIKEWNDNIINKATKVNMKKISNVTYDAFQQIDISSPSLKKVEGNLGHDIYESKIPFNIERRLNPDENLETIRYCENDVLETIGIYKMRSDYFESKQKIVEMLPEKMQKKAYKWNTTSIIGALLKPNTRVKNGRHVSDDIVSLAPDDAQTMWKELDTTVDYKFKTKKVVHREYGNDIEFGWGGLHGAPKGVFEARDVKLLDVASMYPNILINFNGLGDKTKMYKEILDYRLKLKHAGKKKEQAPYKLILNSTYGLLNNQYNALNKPALAYSICIYGQVALYTLGKMLSQVGCQPFNLNTDGVAFIPDSQGLYKNVWKEWEKKFNLTLEEDEFKYWIQKDVNNYVAVSSDGDITTKGGDVNKYHSNRYFANNDIRITHIALVNKLVHGDDIATTIANHFDEPLLYQYVLQAGGTYEGTFDNNGVKLQKINRVFAAQSGRYELFKKRMDGGLVKFPDAPNKMKVYNGDLSNIDSNKFLDEIDLQWYYDLTMKVYERWRV